MKVLFLVPPPLAEDCNVVRDVLYGCWCKGKRIGGATVPPLVALSVSTVLKNDGNEVRLLDAPAEGKSVNEAVSIASEYETVLLLTSSMTFKDDCEILNRIKKANPSSKTIVFGSHPTFMPEACLKEKSIDIIAMREPEFIIRDLLRDIPNDSWRSVKGIGFMEDGKVVINEPYPFIENLDELPIWDRLLLPKGLKYYNPLIRKYPYTTSETSRGCPGKCLFCTAPAMYGGKMRCWSAEKVVREIEQLVKEGYKEIYYRDETFTTFKKRNIEICNAILEKGIKISWLCNVRVGTVDEETLALMKKAGCHTIKIGVESGVQEILDKSNKGIKVEGTRDLFKWAKKYGINTHAHVMIGMPGDTKETLDITLKFLKELDPTTLDVGICTPYPGTVLFKKLLEEHPEIGDDYSIDFDKLHTAGMYNAYFTGLKREELEGYLNRFYKGFYLRPRHMIKNLSQIRNLADLKRIFSASLSLVTFMAKKAKD